jgi:DNA-binding CsgD family transcriptional regulator
VARDSPGRLELALSLVELGAAERRANREIAQRLFITPKTAEAHLARAFRKLNVDSRAKLPATLFC